MSPAETSKQDGYLEHLQEALAYYRYNGVSQVVCQEKHMGSRAVVVLCQDETVARKRFGIEDEGTGIVYTRTGRRFFSDSAMEQAMLDRLRSAINIAGWWEEFATDWFCFDCELMPWSVKAEELLRNQYAAVGISARVTLASVNKLLSQAQASGIDVAGLRLSYADRSPMVDKYIDAYRRYCWQVNNVTDLKLAPFHLLATEGKTYFDQTHQWHMQTLQRLTAVDPQWLTATPYRAVDLDDEARVQEAIHWWSTLTESGGEGTVVKPLDFVARGKRGLLQPAVKSRGREYLRIIYGPEYTSPQHLDRLRERGLGAKRNLALREFALGVEALERFVRREPLRKVHECVFGILALESEPVDPRL
jgi:protein phosphatase